MGEIEAGSSSRRVYVFGPFALDSDLELDELTLLPESAQQVAERFIPVRVRIEEQLFHVEQLTKIDPWMAASSTEFLLTIPAVARFLARDGREVLIVPEADAAAVDIRLYLLGSIFGALCHQNGLLPLHASAVAAGGQVTAFLGDSGAGKSTLAAFLARRGHAIVADDICLLGEREDPVLTVIPVAGWLKLWRASLNGLGQPPVEAHRVLSKEDKYRVYLPQRTAGTLERLRLTGVVLLERPGSGEESEAPRILPISAAAMVAELMNMTYLPQLVAVTEEREALFRRCAQIAGQVKGVRLIAPLGWDRMEEVLDLIERDLLRPMRA